MFIENGIASIDISPTRLGAYGAMKQAALGHSRFAIEEWEAARGHYIEAARMEANDAQYRWLVGLCDWALDQFDSAGARFQEALELDAAFAPAHAWLGEWHLHHGRLEPALRATAVAMELDSNFPGNMQARARVLSAAGQPRAALELVNRMLACGHKTPALAALYHTLTQPTSRI